MIIGISGKIGSGKDTVGQIIQYLVWNKTHNVPDITIMDYLNGIEDYYESSVVGDIDFNISEASGWEVKKFADKLKDIVCILLGCTRKQLEDRNFKEAPLGEEWDLYNLKAGNGENYAINIAKADLHLYPKTMEQGRYEIVKMTPRKMLQILGTEAGRGLIHSQIWVNSLMADYKQEIDVTHFKSFKGENSRMIYPNWIVTDTRFVNEALAIDDKNGILIRVNRGDGNTGDHPSETSLDDFNKWNYVIDNNGSIEELVKWVKGILETEGII